MPSQATAWCPNHAGPIPAIALILRDYPVPNITIFHKEI